MSFSDAWLALREPADHAARSTSLTGEISRRLEQGAHEISSRHPVRIVDLATGTGSNPRFLAPHLPAFQEWTLLDADSSLLSALRTRMGAWATRGGWAHANTADGLVATRASAELRLRPRQSDLAHLTPTSFESGTALVTASALLDLVSASWLDTLVAACHATDASVLFALTYDGRSTIAPVHEDDQLVLDLVNTHQQTDKGFGAALGPSATAAAASRFDAAGYVVLRSRSDWQLGADARTLQDELVAGWAEAARALEPAKADRIGAWEGERRSRAAEGRLQIMVGHEDLAAWPASQARSDHARDRR